MSLSVIFLVKSFNVFVFEVNLIFSLILSFFYNFIQYNFTVVPSVSEKWGGLAWCCSSEAKTTT